MDNQNWCWPWEKEDKKAPALLRLNIQRQLKTAICPSKDELVWYAKHQEIQRQMLEYQLNHLAQPQEKILWLQEAIAAIDAEQIELKQKIESLG
jgi:hypothetical protein